MGIYGSLQSAEKRVKTLLRTMYYSYFETKEIKRKSTLYKDVHWSEQEQREFDAYWMNLLGKKISNKWNKFYQSFNGVYCKEYVPEILYTTYIEPRMNDALYSKVFGNKGLTELLLHSESIVVPETICFSDGTYFFDRNRKVISEEEFWHCIGNAGQVVVKPASCFGSGQGILFLNMVDGKEINTGKQYHEIKNLLVSKEILVQKYFRQHEELEKINPSSMNTIRITTYIVNGEVHYSPIAMRCGSGDSHLDNIHSGGLCVAVEDDGRLGEIAYKLGYSDVCERYRTHPYTGIVFGEVTLPYIDRVIDAACSLHGRTPHIGVIGWDFSISPDGMPVVIEENFHGNGIWFPQIVHGKCVFRDDTQAILESVGLGRRK